jgi:hypothetical protein
MMRLRRLWLAAMAGLQVTAAGLASHSASAEPVDVELILAVDVSLSMSPMELAIQRDGYAAALVHEQVIRAIQTGAHGKIALTYVEWAGIGVQHVVVPWTAISTLEEAKAFADKLTTHPPNSARRTSISSALTFAGDLFAETSFRGMKRVVDISGDGANNQGGAVTDARDALVKQGITINGLPLMTTDPGFGSAFDIGALDKYYEHCVIGGPGAFVIPVNDWSQFPEAVRRKLVLELAGRTPTYEEMPIMRASMRAGNVDCQIGEKMWRSRNYIWDQ